MLTRTERLRWRLHQAGLIAVADGNLMLDHLIMIGDSLWATPLQALIVSLRTPDGLAAIAQLRRRYKDDLLIGAGDVPDLYAYEDALRAGAHFTTAPLSQRVLLRHALTADQLHLVSLTSADDFAQLTSLSGRDALIPLAPREYAALHPQHPNLHLIPTGPFQPTDLPALASAPAVALTDTLITGPAQSMQDLITRGRQFRAMWPSNVSPGSAAA